MLCLETKSFVLTLYNKDNSNCASPHVGNSYGNIDRTTWIGQVGRKGSYVTALEKYHVYHLVKSCIYVIESCTDAENPICDINATI